MAYKVAMQEKFFQTKRVQVAWRRMRNYGKAREYVIVVRDEATPFERHVDQWVQINRGGAKDEDGKHIYTPGWSSSIKELDKKQAGLPARELYRGVLFYNKTDAQREAKKRAVELNLPYNPKTDFVKYDELSEGFTLPCVACTDGKVFKSRKPGICKKCANDLRVGMAARNVGKPNRAISVNNLIPSKLVDWGSRFERDKSIELAKALARLAGVAIEDDSFSSYDERNTSIQAPATALPGVSSSVNRSEGRRTLHIRVSDSQAEAMQTVLDLLGEIGESIFRQGQSRGESILLSLAKGERSIAEFNKYNSRAK